MSRAENKRLRSLSDAKQAAPAPMQVDLSLAETVSCESCGNHTFTSVALMKKLPALISPSGKEAYIPMPTWACNACGHVNAELIPKLPTK